MIFLWRTLVKVCPFDSKGGVPGLGCDKFCSMVEECRGPALQMTGWETWKHQFPSLNLKGVLDCVALTLGASHYLENKDQYVWSKKSGSSIKTEL